MKIEGINILMNRPDNGLDQVTIQTNLPDPLSPVEPLRLKFEVPNGFGIAYAANVFKSDAIEMKKKDGLPLTLTITNAETNQTRIISVLEALHE